MVCTLMAKMWRFQKSRVSDQQNSKKSVSIAHIHFNVYYSVLTHASIVIFVERYSMKYGGLRRKGMDG